MPKNLDDFQDLKYNKHENFEFLKDFKEYKSKNVDADREEYEVIAKIKNIGVKGEPSVRIERIETTDYSFDDGHINKTDHQRNITRAQAESFIDNAVLMVKQRKGRRIVYCSLEGATVIDTVKKIIVTSFKECDFDEKFKKIILEARKYAKNRS